MAATSPKATNEQIERYLTALRDQGFSGDIASDLPTRILHATDNSIYEVRPQAVLFPDSEADVALAVALAAADPQAPVPLTPRGGGTGTNGQALNQGVILDLSRRMNRIIDIDAEAMTAVVEPGVVLDQLNATLAPLGLFFPPHVSTASRATIGGMVATDASGKGSRIYGRTSDHLKALRVVLSDGTIAEIADLSPDEAAAAARAETPAGRGMAEVLRTVTDHAAAIDAVFPAMNRGLTGYNLRDVVRADGRISLLPLIAGSEGTLAVTTRVTLRLTPKPVRRALVIVRYGDFQRLLEDVGRLLKAEPDAIEVLDDRIIGLARDEPTWPIIEAALEMGDAAGVGFVEFSGMNDDSVARATARLEAQLTADRRSGADHGRLGWSVVTDESLIRQFWNLRARAVGLLGRIDGVRRGQAFVEDCAVPPENLAAFVSEFRTLLDAHGLAYGMFGHADVGCLHVRPALDMTEPDDARRVREISDRVAALAKAHGGLLWGEHGRGFRSEFGPLFFGEDLYAALQRIKHAFDPLGVFNPGKLADPAGVSPIDGPPLRGDFDRPIRARDAAPFERAAACNGNGACFHWDAAEPMCPSFKVTRDRTQSPKGRAMLLKEWLRLKQAGGTLREIESALDASLATCLSCKACASQCPVKVDIPAMRSRYLHHRHRRRLRPLRDHFVAHMETGLALARAAPGLANAVLARPLVQGWLRRCGLTDMPTFSPRSARAEGPSRPIADSDVLLLEDGFTSTFDAEVPSAARALLEALGYRVAVIPAQPNGKGLHVRGMLGRFEAVAHRQRRLYRELLASGRPLVGVEAVAGLMFAHEYRTDGFEVPPPQSIARLLAGELRAGRLALSLPPSRETYALFLHCTEKTARPEEVADWATVFQAFGLALETPRTGCCGMAGLFGHEVEHQAMSAALFDISWREPMTAVPPARRLATGFSCRCQTRRFLGRRPHHPAEVLLAALGRRPEEKAITSWGAVAG